MSQTNCIGRQAATGPLADFTEPEHAAKPSDWRQRLHLLKGLPLLPCGAGREHKAPLDPSTGEPLSGWQTAAFTPEQIAGMNGVVRCVGTRCGPDAGGLLVVDVDGLAAVEHLQQKYGLDPLTAPTWAVVRDTAPHRLKLLYRVPERLWPLLTEGKRKTVLKAGDKAAGIKSEQLEVFWRTGQVLLLGEHVPSSSYYDWRGIPDDAQVLDEEHPLWPLVLELRSEDKPQHRPSPHRPRTTELPPRPLEMLLDALQQVPPFDHNQGRREELLGLCQRLHVELGSEEALKLMRAHSPEVSDLAGYFKQEPQQINPGSIWPYLREHYGVDISRHDLCEQKSAKAPKLPPQAVRQELVEQVGAGSGKAELELVKLQLAQAAGMHPVAVDRVAAAVQQEADTAAAIAAEAQALKQAADLQEIAEALTLGYLLPEPIAEAVAARTRYMPVSGPSATLMYLASIATSARLGTQVVGAAASGFRVPANLYGCVVARSGAMKSPSSRALTREPLERLQVMLDETYNNAMETWRTECQGLKRNDEKPPEPKRSHILTNDPSGEALMAALAANEGTTLAMLIFRDELAGLFGSLDQYRGGRGSDKEHLLELYDGGGVNQLRIADGGRYFTRSLLSIFGTVQPEVLQKLVEGGDPNGLWARFLFAPLPARAVRLPENDDGRELEAAQDTLKQVAFAVHRLTPRSYRLDATGSARFRDYHYRQQQAALAATLPAHGALFGKSAGKVLRVAGLMHLAAMGAGTAPATGPIPDATVERAVMLVDHLDGYALGIHADAAAGGPSNILRTVHRIAEAAAEALSVGEVQQKLSKPQRKDWDRTTIAAAMEALAGGGYGEVVTGGRGAIRYRATKPML